MSKATAASCVLRIVRPCGAEELHPLGQETITLGRANINTIILNDALASRFHARIACENGEYVLTDRGSKNGTQVDGADVQTHVLRAGQEVRLGDTVLCLQDVGAKDAPAGDETTEGPSLTLDEVDGLDALDRISDMLATASDELDVLDEVARLARAVVACDRASVILVEEGTQNPLMRFCRAGGATTFGEGPDDHIIRAGLDADTSITLSVPRGNTVLDATLSVSRHVLLVPLRGDERTLGLLILEREPFRPHFNAEELRLGSIAGSHVTSFLRRAL